MFTTINPELAETVEWGTPITMVPVGEVTVVTAEEVAVSENQLGCFSEHSVIILLPTLWADDFSAGICTTLE